MSLKAHNWAWSLNIKSNLKLVLLALADSCNHKNQCWPSYDYLAKKCGMKKRNIIRVVDKLVNMNIIIKRTRKSTSYNHVTNLYIMNYNCPKGGSVNLSLPLVSICHYPQKNQTHEDGIQLDIEELSTEKNENYQNCNNINQNKGGVVSICHPNLLNNNLTNKKEKEKMEQKEKEKVKKQNEQKLLKNAAAEIIEFFNEKTGKRCLPVDSNLIIIKQRLLELLKFNQSITECIQDCKSMIALKRRQWIVDPEMKKYIRIGTLFRKNKFADYIGELHTGD